MDLFDQENERFKPSHEQTALFAEGVAVFLTAPSDPDDTVFLQVTERELSLIGLSLMLFKLSGMRNPLYPLFQDPLNDLLEKMGDAIRTQKLSEE